MKGYLPADIFNDAVCPSCLEPLDVQIGKICRSCGFIVHAECRSEEQGLCHACLIAGKSCRQEGCIVHSRGLCLADCCHGPVEAVFLEDQLGFVMAICTKPEKILLYRRISRWFFGNRDGASRMTDKQHECENPDCLAYEKTVCIASQCFGVVLMHRNFSLNTRATIYDDFVLRRVAPRKPWENTYQMECHLCGGTVRCSGDAARHFLSMNRKPLCPDCRKLNSMT